MKQNRKGESLVGIVVGIFILSFVLLGVGTMMGNSHTLIEDFDKKIDLDFLISSSYSIVNKLDVSTLADGDVFYIHKNKVDKRFDIYVGEQNSQYKYIDQYGNKIDNLQSFEGDVYTRIFQVKKISYQGREKVTVKALVKRLVR